MVSKTEFPFSLFLSLQSSISLSIREKYSWIEEYCSFHEDLTYYSNFGSVSWEISIADTILYFAHLELPKLPFAVLIKVAKWEGDRSGAVNKRRSVRADNNAINISAERSTFSICATDNDAVAERIG